MAVEKYFVKEGIKEAKIDEFLGQKLDRAGYSHAEIQRTPLGTRIIVFAEKPGLIIGKSGKKLQEITEDIAEIFQLENPMLDVQDIENPFLDAQIMANRIAKNLERGLFYKRLAKSYLERIMAAGAIGAEIRIGGKLGGERGRFQKFKEGYIKHAGFYADNMVDKGMATANLKMGSVGVKVKILKSIPDDLVLKVKEERKGEEIETEGDEESEG